MFRRYKEGISLCFLVHDTYVPYFGDEGLDDFVTHCADAYESGFVNEILMLDTSPNQDLTGRLELPDIITVYTLTELKLDAELHMGNYRTKLMDKANHKWILFLDPDERITNWDAIVEATNYDKEYFLEGEWIIKSLATGGDNKGYGKSCMSRLFRNGKYKYVNSYYERLVFNNPWLNSILDNVCCGFKHYIVKEEMRNRHPEIFN